MQTSRVSKYLVNFNPQIQKSGVYFLNSESRMNPSDASAVKEERVVYQFEVTFASPDSNYKWNINKTYEQFRVLARNLTGEAQMLGMKPIGLLVEKAKFMSLSPTDRLVSLEAYLQELLSRPEIRLTSYFLEFLEVSAFSFNGTSAKHKEGYVYKRTGGRRANEQRACNCSKYFRRLQRRWLIIRDTMIGYTSTNMSEILHESLLFKGKISIKVGERHTGYPDGMQISSSQRVLIFRAGSDVLLREWEEAIRIAYGTSEWNTIDNLYGSSFPVRFGNQVQCFIDGEDYFKEVYEALVNAQREVFIADWWLSPEFFLLRPAADYPESQLVQVLGALADRGVGVYVCVYKEVKFALTLSSLHTKEILISRNEKIKVLRHPHRSAVGGEFLWSHHEKLLVIDQQVAFLGGLDLCFGRWDTQAHPLFDSSPVRWPGIDFSNIRVSDFTDVERWDRDSVNRTEVPRMPWHDVGLKVIGKAASDVALHFIELWNHVMTDITGGYRRCKDLLQPGMIEQPSSQFLPIVEVMVPPPSPAVVSPFDIAVDVESPVRKHRQRSRSLLQKTGEVRRETKARKTIAIPCKHFNVAFLTVLREDEDCGSRAVHLNESQVNPSTKAFVLSKLAIPNESPALIRSNTAVIGSATMDENEKELQEIFKISRGSDQVIRVRSEVDHERREAVDEEREKRELMDEEAKGDEEYARNLLKVREKSPARMGSCECQLLRSGGRWSLGLEEPEYSIHTGYLHLIDQADHYIYIENQFFISSTAGNPVKNQIAQALVERIKAAAAKEENFKVIIVIPLLPAFEGSVEDSAAAVLRVELHWEYATICRGARSIMEQLREDPNVKDLNKYIKFYGLRTHAKSGTGNPTTEIVYVHSKMMIIDDDYLLIGSANINDRSLLGSHDSEIAVIVHDTERVISRLNGQQVSVSKLVKRMRMELWKEHTGCGDEGVLEDPLSEEFNRLWESTAKRNTEFYRRVFKCYPDDSMKTIHDIRSQEKTANKSSYDPSEPIGTLVPSIQTEFPLHFLSTEDLKLSVFNKEYYIPEDNFV